LLKPTLAEHPCCYKAQPISYFNFEWTKLARVLTKF
jgi:hypothetical protein